MKDDFFKGDPLGHEEPPTAQAQTASSGEAAAVGEGVHARENDGSMIDPAEVGRRASADAPLMSDYSLTVERQVSYQSTLYEGVIPPSDVLRGYEELIPGSAQLIISWTQDEIQHRRSIELMQINHQISLENRGMELGDRAMNSGNKRAWTGMLLLWPLLFFVVGVSGFLIHEGHEKSGCAMLTIVLTPIIAAYIIRLSDSSHANGAIAGKNKSKIPAKPKKQRTKSAQTT